MFEEKDENKNLETEPFDFEEEDYPKDTKPSYLEGKINSSSVLWAFFFLVLSFWVSNLYWSHAKSLEYYLMLKDLDSTSFFSKAALSVLSHGDLKHFLSNAPLIFIFAVLLNNYYGFLVFPCLSFLSACLFRV